MNPEDPRIEVWKAAFPVGDGNVKVVPSIEKRIKKALGQVSTKCVGVTGGKPCQERIGDQKVRNCERTIEEIVRPEFYLDDTCLDGVLRVLQANMYCGLHTDNPPHGKVAFWKLAITKICEQVDSEVVQCVEGSAPDVALAESQAPAPNTQEIDNISTKTSNELMPRNRSLATPTNPRSLRPDFDQDLATFWPKAYDTTPLEIVPRNNGVTGYQNAHLHVQR
jgi:hypothetical protein